MERDEKQQSYEQPISLHNEKPYGIGKRIGFFFLSLSPVAASFILQIVFSMVYMVAAAMIQLFFFMVKNPDASELEVMIVYNNTVMESLAGGVFLYHLLSLPIFGLWYYYGCKRPKLKQSIKNISFKAVVISVVGGIIMCLMSNGIVGVEQYIIPDIVDDYFRKMESINFGSDILATAAAVILAPVGEEIMCRGIIMYYAKKAFPRFYMANILQALLFGILHGNLIQGVYAFAIGLLLGYLAEKYKSLIPCIILHFTVNFSSTYWIDKVFYWVPNQLYAYLILFVITLAGALFLIWWGGPISKNEKIA